jgi:hypothetical protein
MHRCTDLVVVGVEAESNAPRFIPMERCNSSLWAYH